MIYFLYFDIVEHAKKFLVDIGYFQQPGDYPTTKFMT
jgi:hypothetical protein